MKRNSTRAGRFTLSAIAVATACLAAGDALALGLGRLSVQSALGESLRAEIDITSISPEEDAGLRVRIAAPEAFRAAGVDYNAVLPGTQAVLQRRSDGRPYLRLTSNRPVQEPFVDVILEVSWSTGRLVREYTMLFDPPTLARAPESVPIAPATPARITAAPAPPIAAAPASPTPPRGVERRAAPPIAQGPATPVPPGMPARAETGRVPAGDSGSDQYRVRAGDSLSRIATRTQRAGVSLDQMLVALFRSNPSAFIENNMNRLRAGSLLTVPGAEAANAASPAEARQIIQAQSADFGAYRQRLAGVVPTARTDAPSRQGGGKVEAQVDDRRAGAATSPDTLTLSRGGAAAVAGSAEDRISKQRAAAADASRISELNNNVQSLARAASAAAAGTAPGGRAAPPAPAAPTVVAAAPMAAPPPAPMPTPAATLPAASTAAAVTPGAGASAAAAVATAASATPVVAAASTPRPPRPAAAASAAPVVSPKATGFAAWMDENPLLLAAGAALVALLGGLGIYRLTQRARRDSGETSFLESRLQPDSFFGASGGQRIDTRDAGNASSMSYSLSQLDAIGDVDPVAEADVYLAYGRDLQAEEILKEAMRSTPDRTAIRTKLLEVYAKRRDTKAFELLATQLYGLTRGQGDDWAKAQEMGILIDSDNPMYRPGGAPANLPLTTDRAGEALGASTMPQSVMPATSNFRSGFDATTQAPPLVAPAELDLDLGLGAPASSTAHAATQPLPVAPPHLAGGPMSLDLSEPDLALPDLSPLSAQAPAPAAATAAAKPMEFDLSSISLDLDLPLSAAPGGQSSAPKPAVSSTFNLLDNSADSADSAHGDGSDDPVSRKLDLADEFRQIGDMDGARDLLHEVIAKSTGSVRARAQGMLDEIG